MSLPIEVLRYPLTVDQIEFRVQSINNGGYATILAYKDARVDMQRLDDAVGPLNWKREHTRDNHNCIVSLWDETKGQWVSKEDTGTESNAEAEKGLASDSFKRACFNWGIGRELYSYPLIQIKLNQDEMQERNGKKVATWQLRLKEWEWEITHGDNGIPKTIVAVDNHGKERFKWNADTSAADARDELIEQHRHFLATKPPAEYYLYWQSLTEAQQQLVYGSAKHGEKGTFKEHIKVKLTEAAQLRDEYVIELQKLIIANDLAAVELISELDTSEKRMVWEALTDIEKTQLIAIQEAAA